MPSKRQKYGQRGEAAAVTHLQQCGYQILERNYRTNFGEIDVIAKDDDCIVFVEVKARKTKSYGDPKSAVTALKQRKVSMVALQYLKSTGQLSTRARFDVVAVRTSGGSNSIEVVKNAFDLAYR